MFCTHWAATKDQLAILTDTFLYLIIRINEDWHGLTWIGTLMKCVCKFTCICTDWAAAVHPSQRSAGGQHSSPTATRATGESELLVENLNQDFINRGQGVTVLWIGSQNSVIFYLLKEGLPWSWLCKSRMSTAEKFCAETFGQMLICLSIIVKRRLQKTVQILIWYKRLLCTVLKFIEFLDNTYTTHTTK